MVHAEISMNTISVQARTRLAHSVAKAADTRILQTAQPMQAHRSPLVSLSSVI